MPINEAARYRSEPDLTIKQFLRLDAQQQRAVDARCERREGEQPSSRQHHSKKS